MLFTPTKRAVLGIFGKTNGHSGKLSLTFQHVPVYFCDPCDNVCMFGNSNLIEALIVLISMGLLNSQIQDMNRHIYTRHE